VIEGGGLPGGRLEGEVADLAVLVGGDFRDHGAVRGLGEAAEIALRDAYGLIPGELSNCC